jgi:hypothetical protein
MDDNTKLTIGLIMATGFVALGIWGSGPGNLLIRTKNYLASYFGLLALLIAVALVVYMITHFQGLHVLPDSQLVRP